ncbi:hypothetical protein CEXT_140071 [Caerostris extrusa]|uniref:Uncharacterized protein n=1 Tax=Caerostris extrusa TaxID=172846 RepID=A0AAV4Y498_CAEEX|nr:hypothetical protein CEXT_140071 [Caerostris extrusa]
MHRSMWANFAETTLVTLECDAFTFSNHLRQREFIMVIYRYYPLRHDKRTNLTLQSYNPETNHATFPELICLLELSLLLQ